MSTQITEHPTVRAHRQKPALQNTSEPLDAARLRQLCLDAGADDVHKPLAVAAGLGRMGIHRNVIHPRFGNFILLGTILVGAEISACSKELDYNPCLECKLCVAACPVGAIGAAGAFNFSSCYAHNYREFMGGFGDWVENIADSRDGKDYRRRVKDSESISMWQSLGFGPNYKAAYCMAVCPAGDDVIGPYLAS